MAFPSVGVGAHRFHVAIIPGPVIGGALVHPVSSYPRVLSVYVCMCVYLLYDFYVLGMCMCVCMCV